MADNNIVYKALITLQKNAPDLFFMVRNTKIEVNVPKIPTACASYDVKEKKFLIKVGEQFTKDLDQYSFAALIEHELMHIILLHVTDIISGRYKREDFQTLNTAQDAIINDIGVLLKKAKLHPIMQKGVFLEDISKLVGETLDSDKHSVRDVFDKLKKLSDQQKQNAQKSGQLGEGFDDHSEMNGDNDPSDPTNTDGQEIRAELLKAAKEFFEDHPKETTSLMKDFSRKSSDCKMYLETILKLDKDKKIKREIEKFFTSNKTVDKKSSMKRPNRRFDNPKGHIRVKKQKILLGLDVSGSMMTPDTIEKLQIVVKSATNNEFAVDLVFGDTKKLGEFKNIKKDFDFSKVHGGGGTTLDFIFAEKGSYDCYVVATDGYFDLSDIPKGRGNNTLFISTEMEKIGNYKTIKI